MTTFQRPASQPASLPHRPPPIDTSSPATTDRKVTPPSPIARKPTLPAPIGIPARQRSNTGSSCRPSILSSSPTQTPFSLPAETGFCFTPPPSSVIYEEGNPRNGAPRDGTSHNGTPRNGTPRNRTPSPTTNKRSQTTPLATVAPLPKPKTSPKTSPKAQPVDDDFGDLMATGMSLATSSCAAEALMTGDVSALPSRPQPKRRTSSSASKKGWTRKIFGGDSVLHALDPNRVAVAFAPEPVPTVVFGAETETGVEVCRALLDARHFALVALVVDINTPATAELKGRGVNVIQVDMDNAATYERHLIGAKAVYLSTNVIALHSILQHQPEPKRTEIARAADRNQITKAVGACTRAKVGHVVFRVNACGHEVIENELGKGHVLVGGHGGKSFSSAELDRLAVPHTVLHTSVPYTRINMWLEDKGDGFILDMPVPDDTQIPWFAIEQTGEYVLAALKNPTKWLGADMHAISEVMTPTHLATRLSKLARRPISTAHVTRAEFDSLEVHERLACKWDAWAQLVRHEYDFESSARATKADVADQWCFDAWLEHDRVLNARFKK